ncbi:MAG: hypothetical protein WCK39_10055 [Methanomassiliicoccales archaeon]
MAAEASPCRMEMRYLDPEVYAALVNHELRKSILRSLYVRARSAPITKKELALGLGIGYQQIVYQLNNHLQEFWKVGEERKVRGTVLELIEPAYPNAIFISLGAEQRIFTVDPLANLFGPLSRLGTRCDQCHERTAKSCCQHVAAGACCPTITPSEGDILLANGRKAPFRPLDHAIICALRGIPEQRACIISIPCEQCAFLRRVIGVNL